MKVITTRYHGPTNTRGSRIAATDEDGNRVSLTYDNLTATKTPQRSVSGPRRDPAGGRE